MHATDWAATLLGGLLGRPELVGETDGYDQWETLRSGCASKEDGGVRPRNEVFHDIYYLKASELVSVDLGCSVPSAFRAGLCARLPNETVRCGSCVAASAFEGLVVVAVAFVAARRARRRRSSGCPIGAAEATVCASAPTQQQLCACVRVRPRAIDDAPFPSRPVPPSLDEGREGAVPVVGHGRAAAGRHEAAHARRPLPRVRAVGRGLHVQRVEQRQPPVQRDGRPD